MNTIEELKKQLAIAEQEEKYKNKLKILKDLKTSYEGKVFSSRTFERNSKAKHDGAYYIESIYINNEDSKMYAKIWMVYQSRGDNSYYSYNKTMQERCLTSEDYNEHYILSASIPSYYKHEISVDKFMELWRASEEAQNILRSCFNKTDDKIYDFIRGGDASTEDELLQAYKHLGIEYIDMLDHPKVFRTIEYATLPFFERNRFLLKIGAMSSLQYQINLWKKELESCWNTTRSTHWLNERINILEKFIENNLV